MITTYTCNTCEIKMATMRKLAIKYLTLILPENQSQKHHRETLTNENFSNG